MQSFSTTTPHVHSDVQLLAALCMSLFLLTDKIFQKLSTAITVVILVITVVVVVAMIIVIIITMIQ